MSKDKTIKDFSVSKAILYTLYACDKNHNSVVSKIAIQKLLYLSVSLAPIKDIILDFIRFQFQTRGPYSKEIQNALDSLTLTGHLRIVDYEVKTKKATYANFEITEDGKKLVNELIVVKNEEELLWWITSVVKLSIIYTKENYTSKFSGLDKIVDFVYQEPTFLKSKIGNKSQSDYKSGIRKLPVKFHLKKGTAKELIEFSKDYLSRNNIEITEENEKWIAELLLFNFFEFLYNKILLEAK